MSTIQNSVFEEEVRTAHLDSAHIGDIQGAWGTIRRGDTARRKTWFARLLTLLVIMGPGLVVMIGDNDAGGVATYAQAGQNYGTRTALIDAAAVTLSTSYAFGDLFKIKHSLHRSLWEGRGFYAIYSALVLAAAAIVLIPNAPLGLMTLAVQVLAGILLPSATVFLLLLCNDKAVLGPWVNPTWLNILASLIVGVLVELSLILAAATLFPTLDVVTLTLWLSAALVAALGVVGVLLLRRARRARRSEPALDRATWRMPPLEELTEPVATTGRTIGLLVLRGYLIFAAALVVVKFVQIATGH